MKKKVVSVFLAGVMAVSVLAGCGADKKEAASGSGTSKAAGYAEDAKLKIWGSQEDQDMLKGIIEDFKADNPEAAGWTIETAVVSSPDAKTEILKDPSVAADVFEFASDQIAELKDAGVLYRITKNKMKLLRITLKTQSRRQPWTGNCTGIRIHPIHFLCTMTRASTQRMR